MKDKKHWKAFTLLSLLLVLGGCASVPMEERDARDPFQGFNRAMYTFNDGLDTMLIKPMGEIYDAAVPAPVSHMVTNFFGNLDDVLGFLNALLQGKPVEAAEGFTRVVFNSTFGLLGVFDVASHMDLPKRYEDFGQTLGVWGVDSGPYVVLPFFGPSTVRDTFGLAVDTYTHPLAQVNPDEDRYWLYALDTVDTRAGLLRAERVFDEAAMDPYVFLREGYLQRRERLVLDGAAPPEDDMEME
jgi:phospholipid-binding lipoprotein MlaA